MSSYLNILIKLIAMLFMAVRRQKVFSLKNTDSITIQENALEITDSWLFDLRYMAFNAKKAIFENDYLPSVTRPNVYPV